MGRTLTTISGRPAPKRRQSTKSQDLKAWAEFGKLSAGLIHELSTPLAAATLTLEQINEDYPDQLVKQVRQNLHQLEVYILAARQQLRGESTLKFFSPSVAIGQISKLLSARARIAGVRLDIQCTSGIHLYGDSVKFQRIIANLVVNAIEAFDAKNVETAKKVKITLMQENETLVLNVSDNAVGIASKNLSYVFKPFFTTKSAGGGLGIGLAMVKTFVERDFRGKIKVHSTLGEGTTFTVILPLK